MSAKKRVLCVDDQEDTCALVSAILEEYDVIAEHNKAEGVRQAAMEKFDLILVDYHLPDGTGLELCVLIRAFDPNTPILLVTCTHTITHEQVIAVGGQGVIRKDRLSHLLPVAVASAFEVKFLEEYGGATFGEPVRQWK
jgi:CheY-like chemotaxis protein